MPSLNVFKALKRIDFTRNIMELSHKNFYDKLPQLMNNSGQAIQDRFDKLVQSLNDNHEFLQNEYGTMDASTLIEPAPILGGNEFTKILSIAAPNLRIANQFVPEANALNHAIAEQPYFKTKDFLGIDRGTEFSVELMSTVDIHRAEIVRQQALNKEFANLTRRRLGKETKQEVPGYLETQKLKAQTFFEKIVSDKRIMTPDDWEDAVFNGLKGDEVVTELDFRGMIDIGLRNRNLDQIQIPEVKAVAKVMREHFNNWFDTLVESGELIDIRKMDDDALLKLYTELEIPVPSDKAKRKAFFISERQKNDDVINTYVPRNYRAIDIRKKRATFETILSVDWFEKRMAHFDLRDEIELIPKNTLEKMMDAVGIEFKKNPETGRAVKTKEQLIEDMAASEHLKELEESVIERIKQKLKDSASEVSEKIMRDPFGFFSTGQRPRDGKPMPLHRRVLDIDDRKIWEFLEHDPIRYMNRYDRRMFPWFYMKNKLGKTFDDALKEVNEKFRKAIQDNPEQQKKIENTRESVLRDLRYLADRVMNIQRHIDPSSYWTQFTSAGMKLNQIRYLTQRVVSSFPDPWRPAMVWGFKPYQELIAASMKDFQKLKSEGTRLSEIGIGAELWIGDNLARFDDLSPFDDVGSLVQRSVDNLHRPFGLLTLGNLWDSSWKEVGGLIAAHEIVRIARKFVSGKNLSNFENRISNHLNLGTKEFEQIAAAWARYGESVDGFHITRLDRWFDDEEFKGIAKHLNLSLVRNIDEMIVSKRAGLASIWTDKTNLGIAMNQFRTYSWNASQMLFMSGLQQADRNFMAAALGMIFMGGLTHVAKASVNNYEIDWDNHSELMINAIERSGIMAWFFDINMVLERATQGNIGINPLLGGSELSRYAKRDLAGVIFGPFYQSLDELGSIMGGVSAAASFNEVESYQRSAMIRWIPYSNLAPVRLSRTLMEESAKRNNGVLFQ